ncbi:MAG: type II secretion system F family protein [Dehalococcoidia bacterium]|nr:type II secretion system F family protein [Dehalococcoidia bacterium]
MRVSYEAFTWAGGRVRGEVEAETEVAAYDALRGQQLVPCRLQELRPRRSLVQVLPALFKPKEQVVVDFTRQLSTLLRSGVPLRAALVGLRDGAQNVGLREALRQVIQGIEEGMSFSAAFARHPTVFPKFYVRLLQVAEAAGELGLLLGQIAQLLERQKALRQRVRSALVYPAMTLGIAIVSLFVLVSYSLPALIKLISGFGGELPLATRLLMQGAEFLRAYGVYVMGLALAFGVGSVALRRTDWGDRVWARALLQVPIVGKTVLLSNIVTLMSTLGTLLRSGVPPVESLRLAGQETGHIVVREGVEQVAAEVSAGGRLSQAFAGAALFPPLVAQAMRSGETTGTLPQTVEGLTEYYEKELERAVAQAVELITPVMTVLVAGFVGFVAVAVLSGIYSTLGSIK